MTAARVRGAHCAGPVRGCRSAGQSAGVRHAQLRHARYRTSRAFAAVSCPCPGWRNGNGGGEEEQTRPPALARARGAPHSRLPCITAQVLTSVAVVLRHVQHDASLCLPGDKGILHGRLQHCRRAHSMGLSHMQRPLVGMPRLAPV